MTRAHCRLEEEEPQAVSVAGSLDAAGEDRYWQWAHRLEPYWRATFDYEDYAPAYCVGYVGHAQYGGSYEEAEKCLCANWERIRGGSRLPLEHARAAMRAAWERMARIGHAGEDGPDMDTAAVVLPTLVAHARPARAVAEVA